MDWRDIREKLYGCEAHYRPWEVDRMSLEEIGDVLEAHSAEKKRHGRDHDDHGRPDDMSYLRWWRGLSPAEKLEIKRGKVDW